jgi:ribosomal protein L29
LEVAQHESLPKLMDDSPTFRHAMVNLGISRDDMRKKNIEDFGDAVQEKEKELVQVRYKHYQERLLNLVNCLLQERHRIKNQAYISQGGTSDVSPRY